MKIGILTQPLHNNYGGLLQNFAMQKVLSKLGHESITINVTVKSKKNILLRIASLIKRSFLKIIDKNVIIKVWPSKKEYAIITQNTNRFVTNYIKTTKKISKK